MRCLIGMDASSSLAEIVRRRVQSSSRAALSRSRWGTLSASSPHSAWWRALDYEEGASLRAAGLLGAADAAAQRLDQLVARSAPDGDLRAALERELESSAFLGALAEGMRRLRPTSQGLTARRVFVARRGPSPPSTSGDSSPRLNAGSCRVLRS